MFVKLFGSILDSSIWGEDHTTRIVWITMLAMADEHGMVHASIGGLAHRARVTVPECEAALDILTSPDQHSRSSAHEGRRVEDVEGGWLLLNYEKYRELRSRRQIVDAARQRRHRRKQRTVPEERSAPTNTRQQKRDVSRPVTKRHDVTVEAEAEAEAEPSPPLTPPPPRAEPLALVSEGGEPKASKRETWLTPYGEAWSAAYGGEPSYPQLAKTLKPLVAEHGEAMVLTHWQSYLQQTPARYASPAKFGQTFASWAPTTPDLSPLASHWENIHRAEA